MNFKKRVNGSWTNIPHYIHNTATDTITTLPAVIYANDTTATVGLKGNMYQASGVSPTNPIQPSECGERTGNLFNLSSYSGTSAGISDIVISGNSITFNASSQFLAIVYEFNLGITDIYTLALGGDSFHTRLEIRYTKNGTNVGSAIVIQPSRNAIISGSDKYDGFRVYISNANNIGTCTASNIMLNSGSTALPYEPFGVKIPISSAGTTTPVYLGEVETTRKIKKLVLTGQETIGNYAGKIYIKIIDGLKESIPVFCTVYQPTSDISVSNSIRQMSTGYWSSARDCALEINDPNHNTSVLMQNYLQQQYAAGTPVCVWYVLATPTTGIVNEPLMRIGDYADTLSNVSIPVTAGGDTLSVGTTVQPSEVTVNYKGWHPVQSVHKRENGAWT